MIITSSIGSYRSQYITVSFLFTDAFLPSSPHNTSARQALRRLCCRRCQIAETSRAARVIVASLLSKKSQTLSSHFATVSSSSRFLSSLRTSTSLPLKRHHHDYVLDALGGQLLFAIHCLPDAPAAHNIG